jgi:hypothetical protein
MSPFVAAAPFAPPTIITCAPKVPAKATPVSAEYSAYCSAVQEWRPRQNPNMLLVEAFQENGEF